MQIDRREFLRLSAMVAAVAGLGGAPPAVERRGDMPYRVLGSTGEHVSLLCLGGNHIGVPQLTEAESIRIMRTAVDEGVNFFDNAHMYYEGRSEELMGKALRDGYRDKIFLMTKFYSKARDVEEAQRQLEESLARLQTDVLDLWQVHMVQRPEDPAAVYESGLLDFLSRMRTEGKIRYVGFTGHARPEFHVEMMQRGFRWDACQMPLNACDHHWVSFEKAALAEAVRRKIGVIAMKTLGGSLREWPGEIPTHAKALSAQECIRYAMNLPVAAVAVGMDSLEVLRANIKIAEGFEPLTDAELQDILGRCLEAAEGGAYEPYKLKSAT